MLTAILERIDEFLHAKSWDGYWLSRKLCDWYENRMLEEYRITDNVTALFNDVVEERAAERSLPITPVLNAWVDEGAYPLEHRRQKRILRDNWPTLYNALNQLEKDSDDSCNASRSRPDS